MDADEVLQWHAEWKVAAARIIALAIARLDAVMAELGFERDEDGGWRKVPPVPAPRPKPVPVPRIPRPRPPVDLGEGA